MRNDGDILYREFYFRLHTDQNRRFTLPMFICLGWLGLISGVSLGWSFFALYWIGKGIFGMVFAPAFERLSMYSWTVVLYCTGSARYIQEPMRR